MLCSLTSRLWGAEWIGKSFDDCRPSQPHRGSEAGILLQSCPQSGQRNRTFSSRLGHMMWAVSMKHHSHGARMPISRQRHQPALQPLSKQILGHAGAEKDAGEHSARHVAALYPMKHLIHYLSLRRLHGEMCAKAASVAAIWP